MKSYAVATSVSERGFCLFDIGNGAFAFQAATATALGLKGTVVNSILSSRTVVASSRCVEAAPDHGSIRALRRRRRCQLRQPTIHALE